MSDSRLKSDSKLMFMHFGNRSKLLSEVSLDPVILEKVIHIQWKREWLNWDYVQNDVT